MAFTLEAALVLPLSISMILSIVPQAAQTYRQTVKEADQLQQSVSLSVDPPSLYALVPVTRADHPANDRSSTGLAIPRDSVIWPEVLMTSPKLMFCLVTAMIDDARLLGLSDS